MNNEEKDFIFIQGEYDGVEIPGKYYQCNGLDGVRALYRLEGDNLKAVDAGQMSDMDEDEIMGSAPNYWDVDNSEYGGVINVDLEGLGKTMQISVVASHAINVKIE